MAKKFKLAELLLRRKELQGKVDVLKHMQVTAFYETKAKRVKVTDDLDDVIAQVPKLTASQVTAEYDWHSRALRLVDAAIQQANWTIEVDIDPTPMSDYAITAPAAAPAATKKTK